MSNKSYCMLCNAELISLVQPPAEYGYLCASCKVKVLTVGKKDIDHIFLVSQATKQFMQCLGRGGFSTLGHVDVPGTLGEIMKERQNQELYNTFSEKAEEMKRGEDEK